MVKIKKIEKPRANEKLNFTPKQEERLIEYVKRHSVLYDMKNTFFRNATHKKKLWDEIGSILCKNGNQCARKWTNIRDYYVKLQQRKSITSAPNESTRKRNEQLKFLNDMINKKNMNDSFEIHELSIKDETITNDNDEYEVQSANKDEYEVQSANKYEYEVQSTNKISNSDYYQGNSNCTLNEELSVVIPSQKSSSSKSAIIQKYDSEKFKFSEQELEDQLNEKELQKISLDQFFASMCSTVKMFSAIMQVHAKMQISQLIGEMELDFIEKQSSKHSSIGFATSSDY